MLRPSKVDSRSSAWVESPRFKALAPVIIEKRPTAHPLMLTSVAKRQRAP